jgi:DNA invertase Pin-like site-specific DNA recombinase
MVSETATTPPECYPMTAYSYLRFSSREQAKGESIARQVKLRDAYLERNGLTLDDSLALVDPATSSFRGKNRQYGRLKLFLDACEKGRVKRGSVLIVESLDRLSRESAEEHMTLFMALLGHGVTIVTLLPAPNEFKPGHMTIDKWVVALAEMMRSHSESAVKSSRIKSKWETRRKDMRAGKIGVRRHPSWLQIIDGKFALDEVKADAVRTMFTLASQGYGAGKIARHMNTKAVKPISKAKRWTDCYVHRVLTNKAVIGEYQPCTLDEKTGKFLPEGDPIPDYFPPVVTQEVFRTVQTALNARKTGPGKPAKTGGTSNNLFSGLLRIGDENAVLRSRGGYDYIVSNGSLYGGEKKERVATVPYPQLEHALLIWLRELRLGPDEIDDAPRLRAERDDLKERVAALKEQIRTRPAKQTASLAGLLIDAETALEDAEQRLQVAEIPKANQVAHTKHIIKLLETADKDELESLRMQLKQQIAFLVDRIEIDGKGKPHSFSKFYWLTIHMRNGTTRRFWFSTDRVSTPGVKSGPWKVVMQHGVWWKPSEGVNRKDDVFSVLAKLEELRDGGETTIGKLDINHTIEALRGQLA